MGLCAAERRTDLRGLTEHFAGQVRLTRQKLLACSLHTTVPHCARTVNLLQLLLPIAQLQAHLIILIKAIALNQLRLDKLTYTVLMTAVLCMVFSK